MTFGHIRNLREDNNLTQEQVSKIRHISQRAYFHYEKGTCSIPIETLIALANYYNISADYLAGRTDKK